MPPEQRPIQFETFILRIWREASGLAWRGEIIHLPDRTSIHVATLDQAISFIARYAPDLDPDRQPVDPSEELEDET
ncbi:MAG: hypothetical protein RMJ54_09380 [Roseiflexaceae bacterium]|nr:hypothetical protein [Roseiflexus sp.]MDW8232980.1 hypothetical protein [Roseiflexaceae bacterium]